jgi:hypothetical protein
VVLDEAQRIKNWATKSAAYVKALTPTYRLVLTGTPMENRFDELASIMDFVDDLALEPKWRLVPLHQVQSGNGGKGWAARATSTCCVSASPARCCAGCARTCSISFRRAPTRACPSS